jgi:hypothetical protein
MVKARAAVNLEKPVFKGEYRAILDEVYELLIRLWEEHNTSPVFAGDEMIFALGGNGYSVVFSHLGFQTLVELRTPQGGIDLRPEASSGGVTIAKVDSPEGVPPQKLLRDLMKGLVDYYREGPRLRV